MDAADVVSMKPESKKLLFLVLFNSKISNLPFFSHEIVDFYLFFFIHEAQLSVGMKYDISVFILVLFTAGVHAKYQFDLIMCIFFNVFFICIKEIQMCWQADDVRTDPSSLFLSLFLT